MCRLLRVYPLPINRRIWGIFTILFRQWQTSDWSGAIKCFNIKLAGEMLHEEGVDGPEWSDEIARLSILEEEFIKVQNAEVERRMKRRDPGKKEEDEL